MNQFRDNLRERSAHIQERGRRGFLRFLFSRSALIGILLLIQVFMLISLIMRWQFAAFAYGGSFALSAAMALYLINHPSSDNSRQTWLILILLVPVLGTVLYLYVDLDIGHRLTRRILSEIQKKTERLLPSNEKLCRSLHDTETELCNLAHYTWNNGGYPLYENTHVSYFPSGEAKFAAMLEELEKAEKFIFLEYFIIDEGFMWQSILDILKRKAAEGVEVRLMYDGTCAFFRLPYRYPEQLQAMGIRCKMFSPIHPMVSTHYNNRDHRKILVIDGHTAFTGGVNLADEYINRGSPFGHWKDAAIMLKGEAVRSFTLMFLQMWQVTDWKTEYAPYIEAPLPPMPPVPGYVIPYGDSPFDDERVGLTVYLDIINRANRYVHIMTPYLIVGSEVITALTSAAKRGVDVRLILPHVPDKKTAFALAYTHYRELLQAGVRIYEYTPGFVHSKVFVSDDTKAVVGTINLDHRSLSLHFECAAYLYKTPAIANIEQDFRSTLKSCQQVTLDTLKKEKTYRRALGFLLKLFAPLM